MKHLICAFAVLGLVACSTTGSKKDPGPVGVVPPGEQTPPKRDPGIDLPSLATVYFDYDDSALRPDAKDGLRRNAEYLQSKPTAKAEVQGNCDRRGTEQSTRPLGKRRAEAAKQYLVDLGIAAQRLSTVSFGEENPASPGSGESAWAKNRRVDFILR